MKYLTENTLNRTISEEVEKFLNEEVGDDQKKARDAIQFIKLGVPSLRSYSSEILIDDLIRHGDTIRMVVSKGPDPRKARLADLPIGSFKDLRDIVVKYGKKYTQVLSAVASHDNYLSGKKDLQTRVRSLSPPEMEKVFSDMNTRETTDMSPQVDVTSPTKKAIAASWEAYVGTDQTKKKIRDLWVALTDETLNEGLAEEGYNSSFKSWAKWYKSTVEADPSIKFLSPEQVVNKLEALFTKGTEDIMGKNPNASPWDKGTTVSSKTVVSKMEESVKRRWQKLIKG
jgi:hypothetical protein